MLYRKWEANPNGMGSGVYVILVQFEVVHYDLCFINFL
jgi:hypothetical protein